VQFLFGVNVFFEILYPFFVFFLLSTAFIANKIVVSSVSPVLFVAIRYGFSGIMLLIIFCRSFNLWKTAKKNFFFILNISVFTVFLPSILRGYALTGITSSRAAFWGTFDPFIAAIYMYILFCKKLTNLQVFSCFIGFFGAIFFIFTNPIEASGVFSSGTYFNLYDFLQIMSLFICRYGFICLQKFLVNNDSFSSQQVNGFTFTISSILCCLSGVMFSGLNFEISENFDFRILFAFFYTIIIGNMIAHSLFAGLYKKMNVTFISLANLSMPLFVHLLGPVFLNEKISPYFFISITFIFIASYLFINDEKEIILNKK
jgi:drug/metabolite transporter (DMT)-like permease